MAKHVILERYTFTPSTKTIVVTGKEIRQEQLLLITNTTTGNVIYNFSDPTIGATSYTTASAADGLESTTIVLEYDTTSMTSTDKLSILVEETYTEMIPAEVMRDPVDKLRVSTPQSMIDTDFEYGLQPTKWDTVYLQANRPAAYYDPTVPIAGITNVTASAKVVTVALPSTTGITAGAPVFVQGLLDQNANGWWLVDTVTTNVSFTFLVNTAPAASLFDATKSYLYVGGFFTGAPISTTSITTNGTTTVTVTTTAAHGLNVGNSVFVRLTAGVTGGPVNGTWQVATIPTSNTFTYVTNAAASGAITLSGGATGTLYARQPGYVEHRAYDGGVQFSNEIPYHGTQTIRQTRRYFRYQSGKGVQFSTGTILKPPIQVESITSSGTTCTVTTRDPHGLLPGAIINISGATQTAYNGNFTVLTAPTITTLTYTALSTPAATPATGFPITAYANSWYGGNSRIGMFDEQNGIFFEFDGQNLSLVRRSSTTQISGKVAVTVNSQTVTGTGTLFADQLRPNDMIVIRGQSYKVLAITSQTNLVISPAYRGTTASNCVVCKTIDTAYKQNDWNIDRLDGTGASGFQLDLSRMQMFYIDYTWYGAGAIRFGFKNNRGEVIYCHRIPNNNVNNKAYMRSGNLPARYEINNLVKSSILTSTLSNAATSGAIISVADTTDWPPSGIIVVKAAADTAGAVEYISYSSKTSNSVTISSRAEVGGATTAQTFTYSATAPILVETYAPQYASTIYHWGSSVIMDGRFDDDKSFVFQGGLNTALSNIAQGTRNALISLRVSPAVDSGLGGLLGAREIINRMQLTLRSMDAYTTGAAFRIEIVLNGKVSTGTFAQVGGSSLAQICIHTGGTTVTGGETIYSFFTTNAGVTAEDLNLVRDLGNSILGGGTALTIPTVAAPANGYPDGPDIITICATPVSSGTNSINARISWTEAQA
jgi:hypothetical protein